MRYFQLLFLGALLLLVAACGGTTAPASDSFSLEPSEATIDVPAGGEVSSFVSLVRKAGFTDTVQMTFENLPAGFEQEWTRDSANGDCSFVLKISSSVTPGSKTFTIIGGPPAIVGGPPASVGPKSASSGVSAQAETVIRKTITVNVTPGPVTGSTDTFSLTVNPNIITVAQGGSATLALNLKNLTNSSINADLSGINLPSGVGINFSVSNPVNVIANGSRSMSAQIIVGANATVGTATVKIKAKVGTKEVSVPLQLNVQSAASLSFNLALNPTSKTVVQGLSFSDIIGETNANITRLGGFSSNITMSAQNVPSGVQVQFGKTTLTTADSGTAVNLAVANTVAPGTYNLVIKAAGGNIVKTASFTFEVVSGAESLGPNSVGTNQLDQTFGTGGLRITEGFSQALTLNRQSDGKFLITAIDQFAQGTVLRLNNDGSLDTSFGSNGSTKLSFNPNTLTVLPSGKLAVAGTFPNCDAEGNCDPAVGVARLNSNGTLDSGFAQNGIFNTNFAIKGKAIGAFAAAGDKLVVLSSAEVLRLTPGGNLDPDFDTDGRKAVDLGGANLVAALDSANRIVAAGGTLGSNQTKVARLSLDGVLDNTFDGDGKATVDGLNFSISTTATGLARGELLIDGSNRIVLAGGAQGGGFGVARLTTAGAPDNTFDGDGKATAVPGSITGGFATGVTLQGSKIVAVGLALNATSALIGPDAQSDFGAVRFNDNGSLDSSFGSGGKVAFGLEFNTSGGSKGGRIETLSKVVVDGSKLMAAGIKFQFPGGGLTMVRFNQ